MRAFAKKYLHHVWNRLPPVQKMRDRIDEQSLQLQKLEHTYLIDTRRRGHPYPLFDSYGEALKFCGENAPYENHAVVSSVVEKQKLFNAQISTSGPYDIESSEAYATFAFRYVREHLKGQPLRVLDFGGAAGAQYFNLLRNAGTPPDCTWTVVETSAMAELASAAPELNAVRFVDSVAKVESPVDFVFTSGALQYTPDPLGSVRELLALRPKFFFFNRTAFTRADRALIGVQSFRLADSGHRLQNQPESKATAQVPFSYVPYASFEALLEKNYRLVLTMPEISGCHLVNQEPIFGNAMLWQRKDA